MQAIGKAVGEGLSGSQDRKVIEKVINSVTIFPFYLLGSIYAII
jgi:hypothetical protein